MGTPHGTDRFWRMTVVPVMFRALQVLVAVTLVAVTLLASPLAHPQAQGSIGTFNFATVTPPRGGSSSGGSSNPSTPPTPTMQAVPATSLVTLTPPSGPSGTQVTITVMNYQPRSEEADVFFSPCGTDIVQAGTVLQLTPTGDSGRNSAGNIVANSNGVFSASATIPSSYTQPFSRVPVSVQQGCYQITVWPKNLSKDIPVNQQVFSTQFQVTGTSPGSSTSAGSTMCFMPPNPTVTPSSTSGKIGTPATTQFHVTGSGWTPGCVVSLSWDFGSISGVPNKYVQEIGQFPVQADGTFSGTLSLPQTSPGPQLNPSDPQITGVAQLYYAQESSACRPGCYTTTAYTGSYLLLPATSVSPQGPQGGAALSAKIWTDKSIYAVGDTAVFCFNVTALANVVVTDISPSGVQTPLQNASGTYSPGDNCFQGSVNPPVGQERLHLNAVSSDGTTVSADTTFTIFSFGCITAPGGSAGPGCSNQNQATPQPTPTGGLLPNTNPNCLTNTAINCNSGYTQQPTTSPVSIATPPPTIPGTTSSCAKNTETSRPHRYVVFVLGVNSSASITQNGFFVDDMGTIKEGLCAAGYTEKQFVYFSYAAAKQQQAGKGYCAGWSTDGSGISCANGNLTDLNLPAIYEKDDTHQRIEDQAEALNWLLRQVIDADVAPSSVQIDIVTHSLGGVVASYWGATHDRGTVTGSHLHSITLIESPVGGIPIATSVLKSPMGCMNETPDLGCDIFNIGVLSTFGPVVLQELQTPTDEQGNATEGSIISTLRGVTDNYPNMISVIESSADYMVSGTLPLCRGIPCVPIMRSTPLVVGIGAGSWRNIVPHLGENLGNGIVVDPNKPVDDHMGIAILLNNHGVPLKAPRTVTWVVETVTAG